MQTNKQDYHQAFQQELKKLNPAQQEAVHHLEGPVLVIAGPGTGKTHILASRIGRILLDTDTQAQNILCLTFTDAGVQAMRQRLLQLIGPEAHRVHIFTFHSFCNTVIQENLAYFGRQNLEPITELEQVELIRELLTNLPFTHPLRRGKTQLYFYEKHLASLFQLMKAEGWHVQDMRNAIETYLDDLPQRPAYQYQRKHGPYQKGDLKDSKIAQQRERMLLLESAVVLFPIYEQALLRQHRYDYADMILWVLEAFRKNELLLRSYQEQYLYFLVDEYQDTNGAQNELLRLLAAYWDNPNLFIVGDDDQSIFEFQGARLKNLTDYYFDFKDHIKVVLLQHNYRSTQAILQTAHNLIGYNTQRIGTQLAALDIIKDLQAALPERQSSSVIPEIQVYPNTFQEQVGILQQLQALQQQGIPWREMAVIYARHQQVQGLQMMLDKEGIPYQTRRRTNILDTLVIRQVRTILQYLAAEQERPFSGDHLLFKILHYRCLGLASLELARLSAHRASLPFAERLAWRQLIQSPKHWPRSFHIGDKLLQISTWLEVLLEQLSELGLPELVERVLHGSGLLTQALQADDRLWQIQIVKSLVDFCQAETARQPRLNLQQLLLIFDQMDSNRIALPLRKDIELEDGVQLVTAHSSKGLEFEAVFIMDANKDSWEAVRRGGRSQFSLPDTLTRSGEQFEEETRRRLFYVAMTRAKERLIISRASHKADGKALQACRFLDELQDNQHVTIINREFPATDLLLLEARLLQQQERPQLPAMEHSAIAKRLSNFQVSISAWHRLLDCPLRFLYEVILQAPQIQRPAASYGDAMHNALQRYFNAMLKQEPKQFPPANELLLYFKEEMRQRKAYFSSDEYERRLEQGLYNLQQLYDQQHSSWPFHCQTELLVQQVEIDGVPVKGIIDRLDFLEEQQLAIVDYKTGSHNDRKIKRPTPANPYGGNYWRQLAFYSLLLENRPGEKRQIASTAICYLDLDKKGQLTQEDITISKSDKQQVRLWLQASYQQILAHDFYEGCGKPTCEWCQFVQENVAPPIHTAELVEEADD